MRDVERFLLSQLHYRLAFEDAVDAAGRDAKSFIRMRYEDLQRDEDGEITRLFRDGLKRAEPGRKHEKRVAPTVKKTSDDLRDVISNFDEVEAYLESVAPASCPLGAMLRATQPEVFECDLRAALDAACAVAERRSNSTLVHVGRRLSGTLRVCRTYDSF